MASSSARICCSSGRRIGCAIRCDRRLVTTARSALRATKRSEIGKVSMTMPDFKPIRETKLEKRKVIRERERGGSVVSRERLDEWLRDSVVEIVKNLREPPLLVHLYAEANGGLSTTATNPEVEDWEEMEEKWGRGEERTPEGVVFVEKLAEEDELEEDCDGGAWGIVAQGRGMDRVTPK